MVFLYHNLLCWELRIHLHACHRTLTVASTSPVPIILACWICGTGIVVLPSLRGDSEGHGGVCSEIQFCSRQLAKPLCSVLPKYCHSADRLLASLCPSDPRLLRTVTVLQPVARHAVLVHCQTQGPVHISFVKMSLLSSPLPNH